MARDKKQPAEKKPEEEEEKKKPEKEEEKEKKVDGKDKKKEEKASNGDSQKESKGFLSAIRPRKRSFFLAMFLLFCAWILVFHDQCNIKQKKREDCGYMGISGIECRAIACFKKDGGALQKLSVTITRETGVKFGMVVEKIEGKDWLTIKELKVQGAVKTHNDALPAGDENRIEAGDSISKIDGVSSTKGMKKALSDTKSEKIVLTIQRSKLPKLIRPYLHKRGKPNVLEQVLTSPGTQRFMQSFVNMGTAGFAAWIVSGYSPASLPIFYFTPAAIVAWRMSTCCHDNKVGGGVPHCYKGRTDTPREAFTKGVENTKQAWESFRKDPKKWSMSWVMPEIPK